MDKNSRQTIVTVLKNWLELAQHECHAIQIGRWSDLPKIQKSKSLLEQPLADAMDGWKIESPGESAMIPVRFIIARLLEMESRNSELLALRKREVREKILLLEQALYDLRNLRGTCAETSQAA